MVGRIDLLYPSCILICAKHHNPLYTRLCDQKDTHQIFEPLEAQNMDFEAVKGNLGEIF